MRNTIRQLLQAMAITLAVSLPPVQSDQNNPELDSLFARLHTTRDVVEVAEITRKIWGNWYQSDDPQITKLMKRGESSMRRARYDEAIKYFSEVIDIAPEFAEGWNRRATVYYMIGEFDLSTDDVNKTLGLEPRHFGALSGQGLIYMHKQNRQLALEYMERALAENPHMTGVKNNIKIIKKMIEDEVI